MMSSVLRRAVVVLLVGLSACSSAGPSGRTGAVRAEYQTSLRTKIVKSTR